MSNIEFWLARPTHYWQRSSDPIDATFSFARRYEDAGFDGMLFFDTQKLAPEALVSLTAAAKETARLGLGTGVTNPMTRHAAVAASAVSTLQVVSNGRAYLGIGRGDSALAHLGYGPTSAGAFEDYLSDLMSYLRGEAVDFPADADVGSSTWRTRRKRVGSSGCRISPGCRWAWRPPGPGSSRSRPGTRTGST